MGPYIARRLLSLVPILLGVSLITFLSMHMAPGDPVDQILQGNGNKEVAERIRANLGLNDPIPVQYLNWLGKVVQGDFGRSLLTNAPVRNEILERLPSTLQLAAAGTLVAILLGVPLGVIAAVARRSWVDTTVMVAALGGLSMPSFWLGLLLILIFGVNLGWFPVLGGSGIRSLVLPAFTVGVLYAAIIARITRSSMLEIMRQEYVQTARAKGLRERAVVIWHALANSMIPVLTVIGIQLGELLAGTVMVEAVFARSGIGSLAIRAISARDFPLVQGIVLFYATVYILSSLLIDLLYAYVDPRIRLS